LAAIKWLLEDYEAGEANVDEQIIKGLKKLEVYVFEDSESTEKVQEIIQGIRHMSGIRDWRPYQKAKVINRLVAEGKTAGEIAKMFGTNSQTVMRFYRTFQACQEFQSDETYGQYWNVEMFRMFEDVIKRPRLRNDWLGWDEHSLKFKNSGEVEYLYKWIVPDPETKERKIPGANYIKDLDQIVAHPEALDHLKNEGATLASALSLTKQKTVARWTTKITESIETLRAIEAAELERLSTEDESLLVDLQDVIAETLRRAKKLKS
jgi:hypothetical protein